MDPTPTPNPAISLDGFPDRRINGPLYPGVEDRSSIRARSDGFKISSELHNAKLTERARRSICRITMAVSGAV
jgi:hypothetical protein